MVSTHYLFRYNIFLSSEIGYKNKILIYVYRTIKFCVFAWNTHTVVSLIAPSLQICGVKYHWLFLCAPIGTREIFLTFLLLEISEGT
jgi:hypothetical protein